jgi:mono/diheme cytochrome c family protein
MKKTSLGLWLFILPIILVVSGLSLHSSKAAPTSADYSSFDYTFGRPIQKGEMTYDDYRRIHGEESEKRFGLNAHDVEDGMDTWHWWVGVDNTGFWRDLAKLTGSRFNYTNVKVDIIRILTTIPRAERFKRLGIINDPDCVAAEKPDQFGLSIDKMKDGTLTWDPDKFGYSSGIIGLQLFKNEKFDSRKWSLKKYMKNPSSVEPPYKVGMSCVFCHIGFNPVNPPVDPNNPKWENLTSAIGNQYLREGMIFGQDIDAHSFIYHYLNSQEPGTSETSRFPSDFINNPTNINSIFRLKNRLQEKHVENITPAQATLIKSMYKNAGIGLDDITGSLGGTDEHPTLTVPHVLTDGADSMGVVMASVRVYVNEGLMQKDWYSTWPLNPFNILDSIKRGFKPQEFDIIGKERKDPNGPWMQTERRMPNMAKFLMSYDSFPLPAKFVSDSSSLMKRGKIAFAENCASCHSSKKPEHLDGDADHQKKAWRDLVLQKDFEKDNYFSDDQRHSVNEIGTNSQRAEGSNAQAGSTWGQMSSQTYKDIRAPQVELVDHDNDGNPIPLYNPLTGKHDIHWTGPTGYYRTPTLVNIWATAPFLHNNSVGLYNGDPSIEGRLAAYEDGMEKLLWPERRLGVKSIKVTTEETSLPEMFPGLQHYLKGLDDLDLKLLTLPKGTPVNLVMNLNPRSAGELFEAYIHGVLHGQPRTQFKNFVDRRRESGLEAMRAKMLEVNTCPDFIEDRGHTFGSHLSDEDKKALIEYLKTF